MVFTLLSVVLSSSLLASTSSAASACRPVNSTFDVAISQLRPTQAMIGQGEVLKKAKKLSAVDGTTGATDDGDPVPVVMGPGGKLYVTDHHHFVKALQLAKGSSALVRVQVTNSDYCQSCPTEASKCVDEFWIKLARNRQAYLCDQQDRPMSYKSLPSSFGSDSKPHALQNDPMRTLVYVLRKKAVSGSGAPCLVRPEIGPSLMFWEFRVAERLRKHLPAAALTVLNSPANSASVDLPQSLIDSACQALNHPPESVSCTDRVANDPGAITGHPAQAPQAKVQKKSLR